jgi:hypothetical protein
MTLTKRVPTGFTVVVEARFVVIGNEIADRGRKRSNTTVHWAVTRLKKQFFSRDPDEIWKTWLFDGEQGYRKHAWSLCRDRPDTPYGYATSIHRALVMNIATDGRTLVHEIVHPFMNANVAGHQAHAHVPDQMGGMGGIGARATLPSLAPPTELVVFGSDLLQVFEGVAFARGSTQQIRRVEGWHDGDSLELSPDATLAANCAALQVPERLKRDGAEHQHHLGLQHIDLLLEERATCRYFGRKRISIVRRPALENVGDVDLASLQQQHVAEHAIEHLPHLADKRLALSILVVAGGFSNDQQICRRVTHSEHDVVPAARQSTPLTVA